MTMNEQEIYYKRKNKEADELGQLSAIAGPFIFCLLCIKLWFIFLPLAIIGLVSYIINGTIKFFNDLQKLKITDLRVTIHQPTFILVVVLCFVMVLMFIAGTK